MNAINNVTPRNNITPIIIKLENIYTVWHNYIIHYPKIHRYSLAAKIDTLMCELIQYTSSAVFVKKENKLAYILKSAQVLDTIKILLKVSNNIEALEMKKYIHISSMLNEIGKIIGGWHNQVEVQLNRNKTSLQSEERK